MTASRSAGVHQQLAHSRAMRFSVGQRAASRLGADLHAKRLEKLETLYPLCEGFLQKCTPPFPDNLGSNVPAHPHAVFITDIKTAVPETLLPSLPPPSYLDYLHMPSAAN
jgi:hypothetical protein